jgi:hypothetical protein
MASVWAGLLLVSSGLATPIASPYDAIVQRNVFRLREPTRVPAPLPETPTSKDDGELTLTGIVDFRTAQWALLTLTERGIALRRYTLPVGQKEDDLEVLRIDAVTATVRVRHGTAELVLTFDRHGPPDQSTLEELSRKSVEQARPFVDEHTRAHELREQRESERRALERATADAELAARETSQQQ